LNPLDISANALYGIIMIPKNNRKVTAEEMLEQCRRNRQEARILEKRDHPYEIEPLSSGLRISAPVLIRAKSKAS
jgi:predicted DNA binding CopG/RHH family protein